MFKFQLHTSVLSAAKGLTEPTKHITIHVAVVPMKHVSIISKIFQSGRFRMSTTLIYYLFVTRSCWVMNIKLCGNLWQQLSTLSRTQSHIRRVT